MSTQSTQPSTQKVPLNKYGYNTMLRHLFMVVITGLPLFLAAGTWAWVYTLVSLVSWTVLNIVLAAENPGLLNERGKPTKAIKAGAKRWDLIILPIYTLLVFIVPIVAGLDYRNGLSAPISPLIHILGMVFLAAGFVPLTWAMATNKFFAPTVQIQTEAGHQVASTGPYRFVRHPGYVGVIMHFIAVPFALGTWVALIPAL